MFGDAQRCYARNTGLIAIVEAWSVVFWGFVREVLSVFVIIHIPLVRRRVQGIESVEVRFIESGLLWLFINSVVLFIKF